MKRLSRSPKFAGAMLAAMVLFVIGLAAMVTLNPVRAEENLGEHNCITDSGTTKYQTFVYPTLNQSFFVPARFETRFDVHNGAFWMVDYVESKGEVRSEMRDGLMLMPFHACTLDFHVAFFNPRGEKICSFDGIRPNWWMSIPENVTSMEFDRLQIRVRNHSGASRSFKFAVMEPVDAIQGTPIPGHGGLHI